MSSLWRTGEKSYDYYVAPTEETADGVLQDGPLRDKRRWKKVRVGKLLKRVAVGLPVSVLALFGILHIFMVISGRKSLFWDVDEYRPYLPNWSSPGNAGEHLGRYPTDATRDIPPITCHSHNDYWRNVPLFDAIHFGCTSVEADVWLFKGYEELYVGHNTASLTRHRTFRSLYVDPLVGLLENMNPTSEFNDEKGHGAFDEDPEQTLVLLVDFKTNGHELFPHVWDQLEPLRQGNYLSYWNGDEFISRAVTVVGTGNTPFDLVIKNETHRDIFFDAPLDLLQEPTPKSGSASDDDNIPVREDHQGFKLGDRAASLGQGKTGTRGIISADDFNSSTSYYASVSFAATIGHAWTGRLSAKQLDLIRGQIRGAKKRGLKARYWETPSWPTSLRNYVWKVLLQEGVDVLNVDDLKGATKLDWNVVKHDWIDA